MRTLARIADMLGCSPTDLLETGAGAEGPFLRMRRLNARLKERDLKTPDGAEKGWVHEMQLAWRRHYGVARSTR